ncbi:hypothetical protein RBU49_02975 [Clostridium sp. MB40-C1]|uniref:hypothetical protein n=1 Tax=Clostridium sp. MB40-C1 TaxID=3070996 RepID=UPI0027DFD3C4|nr:hypothetical protein [Clostridium sp. MB40-C1]WMJ81233.1 hypothetical protein RBU49_02975 [Clostridium sp. MB40-C1]
MVNNNFYIMLEKEWFYNGEEQTLLQKYGTTALMIYIVLLRNLTIRNTFNFSIDNLCSVLLINKNNNSKMVKRIKNTIKELNDTLFIVCLDSNCNKKANILKINNSTTYYCIRTKEPLKEKFIMIYDSEIDRMIEYSKGKKNSLSDLITHFSFICNGFNNSKKEKGYLCYFGSLNYIEQKTGILKANLLSNNKIFIEQNLLLIGNAGGSIEDNKYENASNIYARIENKVEFGKFMKIKKSSLNNKFESKAEKKQQDKQRQLKQLINQWKKDNNVKEYMDKDDLTPEQFEQLHILEINYFNFVISRGKKLKNPKFLTIKRDGTIKEKYNPEGAEGESEALQAQQKINEEYDNEADYNVWKEDVETDDTAEDVDYEGIKDYRKTLDERIEKIKMAKSITTQQMADEIFGY